jgi:hypothetical protein
MSDSRKRDLENRAKGHQTPENVANFLKAKIREDASDLELSRILGTFVPDVRSAALELVEDLADGRKILLEAMVMLRVQVDKALEFAIQPREGDAPLPDCEAILSSIQSILTPEQARIFLDKKEIHELKLVLVPVTSLERYTEALLDASQIMEGFRELHLSEFAQTRLDELATQAEVEGSQIKKWKFAITEGAQTFVLPSWDNSHENFRERINRFNTHYASKGITRLDLPSYIALMYQGLRQEKPIDCEYLNNSLEADAKAKSDWQYTFLNEIDEDARGVGGGSWSFYNRSVLLGVDPRSVPQQWARFRASVVGDIA